MLPRPPKTLRAPSSRRMFIASSAARCWKIFRPDMTRNHPTTRGFRPPFCSLSYPWLKTTGSHVLNESLEPPDGALVGLLARNALTRGAFQDATKIVPAEIFDLWPSLPATRDPDARRAAGLGRQLVEAAHYPAQPFRIHARGPATTLRCHRLSRRSLSSGASPSAGVGDFASVRGNWVNEWSSGKTVRPSGKSWKPRWEDC